MAEQFEDLWDSVVDTMTAVFAPMRITFYTERDTWGSILRLMMRCADRENVVSLGHMRINHIADNQLRVEMVFEYWTYAGIVHKYKKYRAQPCTYPNIIDFLPVYGEAAATTGWTGSMVFSNTQHEFRTIPCTSEDRVLQLALKSYMFKGGFDWHRLLGEIADGGTLEDQLSALFGQFTQPCLRDLQTASPPANSYRRADRDKRKFHCIKW